MHGTGHVMVQPNPRLKVYELTATVCIKVCTFRHDYCNAPHGPLDVLADNTSALQPQQQQQLGAAATDKEGTGRVGSDTEGTETELMNKEATGAEAVDKEGTEAEAADEEGTVAEAVERLPARRRRRSAAAAQELPSMRSLRRRHKVHRPMPYHKFIRS